MKKLIFILMVGSLFAQDVNSREMSEMEKRMLYQANDKSPFFAGLSASILPTSGHAYTGNWGRGFKLYYMPNIIMLGSLLTGGIIQSNPHHHSNEGIAVGSWMFIILWYPFQFQDAIYLAKQHNTDLYKQIYGRDSLIQPKKSIVQKRIDKKKAKKNN